MNNTGVITNSIRCDRGNDMVEEEVLDRDVTHIFKTVQQQQQIIIRISEESLGSNVPWAYWAGPTVLAPPPD